MAVKTEKEKMLAGESYNCLDPDLVAERGSSRHPECAPQYGGGGESGQDD